jgi:hypothetical protein
MTDRADRTQRADREATRALRWPHAGIRRLAAIVVAIGALIGLVYGESLALEEAPVSSVASGLAQAADLRGALDALLAARAPAQHPIKRAL